MKYKSTNKNIFSVYLIYFISMVLFCGVRIMSNQGWIKVDNYYGYNLIYGSLIHILILVAIPGLLYWALMPKKQQIVIQTIQPKPLSGKVILLVIILGVLLFALNIGISSFFNEIIYIFGYETPVSITKVPELADTGIKVFLFELLITAVYPAICEEFLHRGILLNGTKDIGYKKAIFFSGLLFGLMHFSIEKFFYATILGWIFGLIVVMTKSIWTGVILHFINNALNVYLIYASYNGWWLGDFYDVINLFLSNTSAVVGLLASVVVMALLVLGSLFLLQRIRHAMRMQQMEKERILMEQSLEEQNAQDSRMEIGYAMFALLEQKQRAERVKDIFGLENRNNVGTKKDVLDLFLPEQKSILKPPLWVNIFLIGSIVLGVLVTLSTFIWGLL